MVELKEITKDNYEECLNLSVADIQRNFVSSNIHTLAQAWVYYNTAFPFAICADNIMVGFIMLGYYGDIRAKAFDAKCPDGGENIWENHYQI